MTYRLASVIVHDRLTSPHLDKLLLHDEGQYPKLDTQPNYLLWDLIVTRNVRLISHRQGLLLMASKHNGKFYCRYVYRQYRGRCLATEERKSPVSRCGLLCPFPSHQLPSLHVYDVIYYFSGRVEYGNMDTTFESLMDFGGNNMTYCIITSQYRQCCVVVKYAVRT